MERKQIVDEVGKYLDKNKIAIINIPNVNIYILKDIKLRPTRIILRGDCELGISGFIHELKTKEEIDIFYRNFLKENK